MKDKLAEIILRHDELESLLADPAIISDPDQLKDLAREHRQAQVIVPKANQFLSLLEQLDGHKNIIGGDDDLDGDGDVGTAADDRVAFLESRKAAGAIGATDEWNKMEGVVFNPEAPGYVYLAMSDIRYDMTDSQGDIRLSQNRCGIVYRMPVDGDWDISRIDPVIAGGTYSSGSCDPNRIAGPDNLAVLNDGRVLVAEDTGKHANNMLWLWDPPAEPSEWDGEYDVMFTLSLIHI